MVIFETYSKRNNGIPDVFTYEISFKLKNQIRYIWTDFLNQEMPKEYYTTVRGAIYDTICREEGKEKLYYDPMFVDKNPVKQVENYFKELRDTDKILDVIEITFFFMGKLDRAIKQKYQHINWSISFNDAVKNLNIRFQENGVGYEFSNDKIIRVDHKLLHSEILTKTLDLIKAQDYENVNEEFLNALEHFRFKRNKECLNECLKAFETTMKIICKKNQWFFEDNDTAKKLINILLINSFLPGYHESQLNGLKQLLESSIPTIRNKNGAHGQGVNKIIVPDNLASYMLYITGATINLMIEEQKNRN